MIGSPPLVSSLSHCRLKKLWLAWCTKSWRLERRRIGAVVELRAVVVDDVAVGGGQDRHERVAFRVAGGRAGVHRRERDHAADAHPRPG